MGARYTARFRDGKMVAEYENGELTYLDPSYHGSKRSDTVAAPMVMRDIGEYVSPIDGAYITSRTSHRDHMRAHDVVEVGNQAVGSMSPQAAPTTDIELGQAIKRRVEEVAALPQAEYDSQVHVQQAEHAEVAALVTAS